MSRFVHELPDDQVFTNEGRSLITVSPDGRRIVHVANRQLYLRTIDDLEARAIPGSEGPLTTPVFSPDGEWVAYWADGDALKRIPVTGGAAVTLCDALNPYGMSWGDDGTLLYGQPEGIFRVPSAGGTPSLIIAAEDGEQVYGPRMLPGGDAVLFAATRATGPSRWDEARIIVQSLVSGERQVLWNGGSDARYVPTGHLIFALQNSLFALPFDLDRLEVTGGAVPLTGSLQRSQTGGANYDLSRSGTLAYVASSSLAGNLSTLALVDHLGVVNELDVPPAAYLSPRVSPDGTTLAVQSLDDDGERSAIWLYELDGKTAMRRLTDQGSNTYPIWTPDAKRITFASDREGSKGIYWTRADGTGQLERLTTAEDGAVHIPEAWSPDGHTLVFTIQSNERRTLWTLSLDGERPLVPLNETPSSFGAFGAAFAPDGKWIAYHVAETRFQIYLEAFPPNGVRQRVTRDQGVYPVWSPDGRTLYFRRQEESGRLRAVDIATDPVLRFSEPRDLPVDYIRMIGFRSFDPTPDGERFLMRVPAGTGASGEPPRRRIHIVLNWVEELKARVPVP